jgi:hypothetical protein
VGGAGDDVAVGNGVIQEAGGDQSCGVSNVCQEQRTNFVGNFAEPLVVPVAAVGRGPADDHFGFYFPGLFGDLVHVDKPRCLLYPVEVGLEVLTAEVGGMPVAEVSAVGQAEPQGGVSGF